MHNNDRLKHNIFQSSRYHKDELQFMHLCRQGIIACNNNNMRNPSLHLFRGVTHVVIVACNKDVGIPVYICAKPSVHI